MSNGVIYLEKSRNLLAVMSRSIQVLPVSNMASDKRVDYFSAELVKSFEGVYLRTRVTGSWSFAVRRFHANIYAALICAIPIHDGREVLFCSLSTNMMGLHVGVRPLFIYRSSGLVVRHL